jgi:DNA ligase-1
MSEKLDGVRALWDGSVLMTKTGKRINAPVWFTESLGDSWLDGELWLGRGKFQDVCSVLRRKAGDWTAMQFVVFDLPGNEAFEDRLEELNELELPGHVQVLQPVRCEGVDHFEDYEAGMVDGGAEGVMLRRAGSYYVCGTSQHLQKVKRWQDDEAEVVEIGKGVLICEWKGGTIIKLASQGVDALVGEQVTFAYTGFTKNGLPRHTNTIGVRNYE